MIGEVGGGLGHVAAVAGRADTAALAGEGHYESRAARHADRAGEAEAEEPALEIAAEFVLDVSRHGPLGGFPPLQPALEVLGDDLVPSEPSLERMKKPALSSYPTQPPDWRRLERVSASASMSATTARTSSVLYAWLSAACAEPKRSPASPAMAAEAAPSAAAVAGSGIGQSSG